MALSKKFVKDYFMQFEDLDYGASDLPKIASKIEWNINEEDLKLVGEGMDHIRSDLPSEQDNVAVLNPKTNRITERPFTLKDVVSVHYIDPTNPETGLVFETKEDGMVEFLLGPERDITVKDFDKFIDKLKKLSILSDAKLEKKGDEYSLSVYVADNNTPVKEVSNQVRRVRDMDSLAVDYEMNLKVFGGVYSVWLS